MRRVVKRETKKYSYLTLSKNVSTAQQLIKAVELNGGIISDAEYTQNFAADAARKHQHAKFLMFLCRQWKIPEWWTITPDNLELWIQKMAKFKPTQDSEYQPISWEKFEEELQNVQKFSKSQSFTQRLIEKSVRDHSYSSPMKNKSRASSSSSSVDHKTVKK